MNLQPFFLKYYAERNFIQFHGFLDATSLVKQRVQNVLD